MQFVPVIVEICRTNMFTVLVINAAGKRWLLLRNIATGSKTCIWIIRVTTGEQRDFAEFLLIVKKAVAMKFKVNITSCMQVYIHVVS